MSTLHRDSWAKASQESFRGVPTLMVHERRLSMPASFWGLHDQARGLHESSR